MKVSMNVGDAILAMSFLDLPESSIKEFADMLDQRMRVEVAIAGKVYEGYMRRFNLAAYSHGATVAEMEIISLREKPKTREFK